MCVIIIKQKNNQLPLDVAKASARINPHGLGIVWLDTFEVTYHKSKEYNKLITNRPFIAHFRYATVGKIGQSNTHPFVCGKNKDELLMMNGTIPGKGNHEMCDSKELAIELGDVKRIWWKKTLEQYDSRFVTINTKFKSFQIYNRNLYTYKDGIWYSKANVLQDNLIAVYGTLKKGYSNNYSYLRNAKHIGQGKTKDKYPLVVKGLPYLVEQKGKGHNVVVDVYKVSDVQLERIDALEGHPNWYERKQVPINVNGKTHKCWVYFNLAETNLKGEKFYQSYKKQFSFSQSWKPSKTYTYKDKTPTELRLFDYIDDTPIVDDVEHNTYHIGWDDNDFPTKETPYCVECYNDLDYDQFANYYCSACGNWFTETDVLTHNN